MEKKIEPDREYIGKYTVIRCLGRGGEGTVYLARDEDLHRLVAVKQVRGQRENQCGMENGEADFLRQLKHPMLPVIYELLWDEGWYLVMEFIQGVTLQDYIDRNGYVSEEQACVWAEQLLDVTEYLHTRKPPVIYRDFKPDNIMVCPDGHLRLVDFGAAAIRNYGVKDGTVMAMTPGYGAPEQYGSARNPREHEPSEEFEEGIIGKRTYADERSDIYALGKVMYYMLTGADPSEPPYTSLPIRDYQPLVHPWLERVVRKCIEDDPGKRYQMAEEIRRELQRCGKRRYRRRSSFIRVVEKKVWLTEMYTERIN
ncbi:MAG: serine/threonine protein kinase [Lachnospiraceae bacterium]|nr:serine/threonine protein kinase [Lachnospiraceae bacterium]